MNESVFVQKLRSVMSDNKFRRMVGFRTKGDIDQRRLWRAKTGAKNVFREESARKGKEYSVVLLLDESGSMDYEGKFETAREVTIRMARSLERIGVEFAVVGFNCAIRTHKSFDDKFDQAKLEREMTDDLFSENHPEKNFHLCQGNHNYDALELGFKMLSRKRYGKILLHISDGHPSCDSLTRCGYDGRKHEARNIAKLVKSYPDVIDVGVGVFQTSVLPQIHDEVISVNDLEEFNPKIIEFLTKHIRRG